MPSNDTIDAALDVESLAELAGAARCLEQRQPAVGAGDLKRAVGIVEVGFRHLEELRGDLSALLDHELDRCFTRALPAVVVEREAIAAHAVELEVGIALAHGNMVLADAQPFGGQTAIERGVPLSRRLHCQPDHQPVFAGEEQRRLVAGRAAGMFEETGDA